MQVSPYLCSMSSPVVVEIQDDGCGGRGLFCVQPMRTGEVVLCEQSLVESWGHVGSESQLVSPCVSECGKDSLFQAVLESLCPNGMQLDELLDQVARVDYRADEPLLEAWQAEFEGFSTQLLEQFRFINQKDGAISTEDGAITTEGSVTLSFPFLGSDIRSLSPSFPIVRQTLPALQRALKEHEGKGFLSRSQLVKVFYTVFLNSFELTRPGWSGKGLFPLLSMCNHSCEPNCFVKMKHEDNVDARHRIAKDSSILPLFTHNCVSRVYEGSVPTNSITSSSACLVTLRDLAPGEQLYISYIDYTLSTRARRALLSEGYGFDCVCARCASDQLESPKSTLLPLLCQYQTLSPDILFIDHVPQFEDIMDWRDEFIAKLKLLYSDSIGTEHSHTYLSLLNTVRKQPKEMEKLLQSGTERQHCVHMLHTKLSSLVVAVLRITDKIPSFIDPDASKEDAVCSELVVELQQSISIWSAIQSTALALWHIVTPTCTINSMHETLALTNESIMKPEIMQALSTKFKAASTCSISRSLLQLSTPFPLTSYTSWEISCSFDPYNSLSSELEDMIPNVATLLKSYAHRLLLLKTAQLVPNDPALQSYLDAYDLISRYFPA